MSKKDRPWYVFSKMLYQKLVGSSQVLEDFLDFHGAKNNEDWYLYRELCAAVRHICLAGYCQKHIINRLVYYDIEEKDDFKAQGIATLVFITDCLKKLAPAILHEAERHRIDIPYDYYETADFPGIVTGQLLDHNIDEKGNGQTRDKIVHVAGQFLSLAGTFEPLEFYEPYSNDEILNIVPEKINEVEVRRYEMLVHNLQSYYDTYVVYGSLSTGGEKLRKFRSYFSVVFHLLQMMGRLLHFYERHLHDAGHKDIYKTVQNRLSELIDTKTLLDRTINYGLYYVCYYLSTGKALAQEILNENVERSSVKVTVPVTRGFHSRPSLLVAKIVQHYGGPVELCVGDHRFDAGSVLDIQWAGGKIQNENIMEVIFEGDDRALKDIQILASVNYCEDASGKGLPVPRELSYLRE